MISVYYFASKNYYVILDALLGSCSGCIGLTLLEDMYELFEAQVRRAEVREGPLEEIIAELKCLRLIRSETDSNADTDYARQQ
jgi:hypothetical protein